MGLEVGRVGERALILATLYQMFPSATATLGVMIHARMEKSRGGGRLDYWVLFPDCLSRDVAVHSLSISTALELTNIKGAHFQGTVFHKHKSSMAGGVETQY